MIKKSDLKKIGTELIINGDCCTNYVDDIKRDADGGIDEYKCVLATMPFPKPMKVFFCGFRRFATYTASFQSRWSENQREIIDEGYVRKDINFVSVVCFKRGLHRTEEYCLFEQVIEVLPEFDVRCNPQPAKRI